MIAFAPCSTWAPDFVEALRRHYTGSRGAPPGKKLAWRILEKVADGPEPWVVVGWLGLGEPSYKLAPRRRLGLADARPLPHTVSNFIFRLEGPRATPASQILRRWVPVAADAWEARYGWRPVHWETMVGQGDTVLGACFRGARWRSLGWTTGRTARRQVLSQTGNHSKGWSTTPREWGNSPPKLVFYYGPLTRLPNNNSNPPETP